MSISAMKRMALIGFREDLDAIGNRLVELGAVEPASIQPYLKKQEVADKLNWEKENPYGRLETKLLSMIDTLKVNMDGEDVYSRNPRVIDAKKAEMRVEHIQKRMQPLVEEKEKMQKCKDRLIEMEKSVIRMQGLNLPIQQLRQLKHIHRLFGRIARINLTRLQEAVEELPVLVVNTWREDENVWIMAFFPPGQQEIFVKTFKSLGGEDMELPSRFAGTPEVVLAKLRKRLAYYDLQIQKIDMKLKELGFIYENKIRNAYWQVAALNQIYGQKEELAFSKNLFILTGWLPIKREKDLDHEILDKYPAVVKITADEYEADGEMSPPTLLDNKPLFRPFELIVKMYGLPDYNETDPTPLVGLTFILMFGMMFGDVGQGLLIALAGYWLYKKGARDGGAILGMAGALSMVFGCLYGSVFGFEEVIPALWLRPMSHIQSFLILAVLFGIVFIILGMVLNIINGIKQRDYERMIFDRNGILGLGFYLLLLWFAYGLISGGGSLSIPLFIGIEVGILLLMGLKGVFLRWAGVKSNHEAGGVESIFEILDTIIGFISNTVSFIRVGAFALNHVGLFMAVFLIAQMLQKHGGVESLGGWMAIVIGNVFIIGLEGLIVGIQALRLEFYEFFSKFYSGNGRDFHPMVLPKRNR